MKDATIINFDSLDAKRNFLVRIGTLKGVWRVELAPWKPKRSNEQNRFYWVAVATPFAQYLSDQDYVYVALYVGFGVVDDIVNVIFVKPGVTGQFVGIKLRAAGNVSSYMLLQGILLAVGYMLHANLAGFPVQDSDNQFLARAASPCDFLGALILVHEPRKATDKGFVNFYALAFIANLLEGALLHSQAEPVQHEPSGLLADSEITGNLVATDAILTVGEQPHSSQPLVEADRAVFKQRTLFDGELPERVILGALPQPPCAQVTQALATTSGASDAFRLAHCNQEVLAAIQIGEVNDGFLQGVWPSGVCHFPSPHHQASTGGQVSQVGYYPRYN